MIVKSRLVVILAAALPAVAAALGLGDAEVQSRLNQPLSAQIPVLSPASDDLKDLTVALASREAFERAGLDRPAILNNLSFRVSRDAAGHGVVDVRSSQPVTEPFLTFLLAIDWPRGHLVREYTLLLDPPVFEAAPSAPAAVMAPASGVSGQAAGTVERAVAAPSAAPVAATEAPSPTEHRVVAGETLSSVIRSQGYSSAADVNRALVATFRANPSAFDGNINRLHRGALLRLPPKSEWSALGVDEATAEVHRQVGQWKGDHSEARLRLVVPTRPVQAPPAPSGGTGAGHGTDANKISQEVADARHLLELKNAELARLEAQLAAERAAKAAAAPVAPVTPSASPDIETPKAAAAVTAAPNPPSATVAPRHHSSTVLPVREPSFMDLLLDNALALIGSILVLLLLALAFLKWRARRQEHAADAAGADDGRDAQHSGPTLDGGGMFDRSPRSQEFSRFGDASAHDDDLPLAAESASFNALSTQAIPHSATPDRPPLDSRLGAESSITLHHLDPIAEADFHIAYGLYGQAVDILKLAIELDPSRTDLKLKLLEVHFVAGESAAFLARVRELDRAALEPAAWDRVAVMGRQLAPHDPLFAGTLAEPAAMDLDLGSGLSPDGLDLELAGGDTVAADGSLSAPPSDFHLELERELLDLSATLDPGQRLYADEETLAPRVPSATAAPSLDGVPADSGSAADIDLEDLGIPEALIEALPAAAPSTSDTLLSARPDDPTRLMPSFGETADEGGETRRMPSVADRLLSGDSGQSAEELLAEAARLLEEHWSLPPVSLPPTTADTSASLSGIAEDIVLAEVNDDSIHPTAAVPVVRSSAPTEAPTDPRTSLAGLRMDELNLGDEPLEFDLDDLARALQDDTLAQPGPERSPYVSDLVATGLHVQPAAVHADGLDDFLDDDVSRSRPDDFELPDLNPVTLSEVGTKLDLARAYLDMSDPEGARAILDEVMAEGSPSQKSEAQRILETLPG
jgi:pilus assembly protein FimV